MNKLVVFIVSIFFIKIPAFAETFLEEMLQVSTSLGETQEDQNHDFQFKSCQIRTRLNAEIKVAGIVKFRVSPEVELVFVPEPK